MSQPTTKAFIVGVVVLALFLAVCGICTRRQRLRRIAARIPQDHGGRWPTRPQESYDIPSLDGYHGNYQATLPPPAHTRWQPHFPSRQPDAPRRDSRQRMPPAPAVPVSPPSRIRPLAHSSMSIPQFVSPFNSPTPSPSSPARRVDPVISTPMPSIRPRTTSPPPPTPFGDLPRTSAAPMSLVSMPHMPSSRASVAPLVVSMPAASSPPRGTTPLVTLPSSNTEGVHTHTVALPAMHTGTSNNNDEPPPAYTPIG
ncbi:hypothetical protein PAXRUDRAFT_834371 [Paxillus rubicundulus Ve08.2h10]|uniref:Uncharacterized protein n=1 Tax=Paxillus rubicundulus Ve08.2h10 TaxID=930991 RepID=A0A0D0C7C0_9AGAM|nr:hypothetical protein PAXRUDRAFT_834371 [Paxillus rubicundulus Ve08.2h10]